MSDLKRNNPILIDFETGGLDPSKNPITEVALVSFCAHSFKEIDRYKTYVQEYGDLEYTDKALEYTGITMDDVASGKPLGEVVGNLISHFEKANTAGKRAYTKKPFLVGHNLLFDISFLVDIFKREKKDLSRYLDGKTIGGVFIPSFVDTMWLSRLKWANSEVPNHTLTATCAELGVDLFNAHSALDDVLANKEAFIKMIGMLRSAGGIAEVAGPAQKFRDEFRF